MEGEVNAAVFADDPEMLVVWGPWSGGAGFDRGRGSGHRVFRGPDQGREAGGLATPQRIVGSGLTTHSPVRKKGTRRDLVPVSGRTPRLGRSLAHWLGTSGTGPGP
ncbi:hypothetical protein GCM10009642_52580 [Nocardiopsis metallicus]